MKTFKQFLNETISTFVPPKKGQETRMPWDEIPRDPLPKWDEGIPQIPSPKKFELPDITKKSPYPEEEEAEEDDGTIVRGPDKRDMPEKKKTSLEKDLNIFYAKNNIKPFNIQTHTTPSHY
jgi:hypothetical protein